MKVRKYLTIIFGLIILVITIKILNLKGITPSNFIVYTNSIANYNLQIYSIDVNGNEKSQLTSNESSSYAPSISPDGHYLAFTSAFVDRDKNSVVDIYLLDIAANRLAQLTHFSANNLYTVDKPSWSPDGKQVAFLQNDVSDNKSLISIININGSNLITNAIEGTVEHLTWSPNGDKIAFDTTYSGKWLDYFGKYPEYYNIYIWDIRNLKTTILIDGDDKKYAGYPNWSPDGQQIAYASWKSGDGSGTQIYSMNADGSNQMKITKPEDQPEYNKIDPIWSPDGKQLVFRASKNMGQGTDKDCLLILLANNSDCSIPLYIVDNDGKNLRELVSKGANMFPNWSSDGKKIAFLSIRSGKFAAQLYTVDVIGQAENLVSNELIAPNIKYGPLWGEIRY